MAKGEIAPHVTAWVLVALVVAVILYDTWAATSTGAPTISGFFRAVSSQYPILSFALGVLVGHLLWPGVTQGV